MFVSLCHYIEWENCLRTMLSYSIVADQMQPLISRGKSHLETIKENHADENGSKETNG